jgi:DNA-binding NarL/FixJ family response regulator
VIEYYQAARKLNEPFDVVIMDLTVPGGLGGQEAIAHLRDFDPNIKAIVSSGYANDPIIAEYEKIGFCGFVIKPYRFDELNKVLNQVVNK